MKTIWNFLKEWNAKTQKYNVLKHIILGGIIYVLLIVLLLSTTTEYTFSEIAQLSWFLTFIIGGIWEGLQHLDIIPGNPTGKDLLDSQLVAMVVTLIIITLS